MRKTLAGCVLAPLLLASGAKADGSDGRASLTTMVQSLGSNPVFTADWIDLLPKIANVCGMKVVKAQLFNLTGHFIRQHEIEFVLQRIQSGEHQNDMEAEWDRLDSFSHPRGCAVADKLWGEDGQMFPGVLRKL